MKQISIHKGGGENDVVMPKNGHSILQTLIGILGQLDTLN
jgi:hypothetical protein